MGHGGWDETLAVMLVDHNNCIIDRVYLGFFNRGGEEYPCACMVESFLPWPRPLPLATPFWISNHALDVLPKNIQIMTFS